MTWFNNHSIGTYQLYNPDTGQGNISRDVVFLEPKETRKPVKELAIIEEQEEKSWRPMKGENEINYVSDNDGNKHVQESDSEDENGDTPYLIPPEEQSTNSSDEAEINGEEQDLSCAFRIPTRSVLAKSSKRSNVPQRKSPRLSQASYNSARTTRNSKEHVNRDISVLMKESGTDSSGKVSCAMRNLEVSYNPDASGILYQVAS